MAENMGLISAYVKYPHGVAQKVGANRSKSISPRRYPNREELDRTFLSSIGGSRNGSPISATKTAMFYPEKAQLSHDQKSILNRAKENLRKLKEKNEIKK